MSNAPTLNVERTTRKSAVTRRTSPTKRKQYLAAYLFLLPFFVVFITMLVCCVLTIVFSAMTLRHTVESGRR